MNFKLEHTDGNARAGKIETTHGVISTPFFMPCGTIGAVKAVRWNELEELGYGVVLMNALHLHLRPGRDTVRTFGGLHEYTSWKGSILTDSGGYQFFSLKGLFEIDEGGVSFQSPYDGSRHRFTPESVMDLQMALGSDIIMPLDQCAPGDATREEFAVAAERTLNWLVKAKAHFERTDINSQALFGIIQGGTFEDLRLEYVEKSAELDLPGYALGGISVGEDRSEGEKIVNAIVPVMPADKPRYLMGVGLPGQILDGIEAGIDMFDCVLPTRMARNGTLFTSRGRLNIKNARMKEDAEPVDRSCGCDTCRRYSRAYLAHLYKAGDPGVLGLLSRHNLAYYKRLVDEAREAIEGDRFVEWKGTITAGWSEGNS